MSINIRGVCTTVNTSHEKVIQMIKLKLRKHNNGVRSCSHTWGIYIKQQKCLAFHRPRG